MTDFQEKTLDDRTVGDALRTAREERGESIEDVEGHTQVGKKYILALEQNDLKKLPEPIYAKKFVKALAAHFGLDPDAAAESLLRELTVATEAPSRQHPINFIAGRSLTASPILFKTVAIIAAFIAVVGYFAFSLHAILKPPSITLYSPHDDQIFPTSRVVLEGLTEREVDLSVNGEPISIEGDGSFKDMLNLPPGVSNLRIVAKKKHSRENTIFLKVVVQEAKDVASAAATNTSE